MGNVAEEIHGILKADLLCSDLRRLLDLADGFLVSNPNGVLIERCTSIKENYDILLDYAARGIQDPQRGNIYQDLLRSAYSILLSIDNAVLRKKNSTYASAVMRVKTKDLSHGAILANLESFVSSLPLLAFEPDETRQVKTKELYKSHQEYVARLFDYLLTSGQWTETDASFYANLLVSPTIDTHDACVAISAITLSLLGVFDVRKLLALYETFLKSEDETVRQRALVGVVLNVRNQYAELYPEVSEMVSRLCSDEATRLQMLELQCQIAYVMSAKEDSDVLKKEIIPGIVAGQNIRINKLGRFEEIEDDPMDDILGTGKSDERMARMEEGMRRMMEMEKSGVDIYFGGFSQMKRFPFFYTISNWFVPFYIEHPDLGNKISSLDDKGVLKNIVNSGNFCDSDRYSFAFGIASVFDRMPPAVREALAGEIQPPQMDEKDEAGAIRRRYLQDLYRFFELYTTKTDFENPFDSSHPNVPYLFIAKRAFVDVLPLSSICKICSFFIHRKRYKDVVRLLSACNMDQREAEWHKYMGIAEYYLGESVTACENLAKAYEADPADVMVLRLYAYSLMKTARYDEAARIFAMLTSLRPDVKRYNMMYCLALINSGQTDIAVNKAYELSLKDEKDLMATRILAWTLLCAGRSKDAVREYGRLLKSDAGQIETDDRLNAAYAYWVSGDLLNATYSMKMFVNSWKETDEYKALSDTGLTAHACILHKIGEDRPVLKQYGVSTIDCDILIDTALREISES